MKYWLGNTLHFAKKWCLGYFIKLFCDNFHGVILILSQNTGG